MPASLPMQNLQQAEIAEGLRHHGAGRFADAAQCYRQALSTNSANADALLLMGILARQAKRFPQAVALTLAAVRLRPEAAHFRLNLGHAYGCAKEVKLAEQSYRTAVRLDSTFSDAHVSLGNLFYEQGKFPAAEAQYRQAYRQRPNRTRTLVNLANALLKLRRNADAIQCYLQALAIEPKSFSALHGMGYALVDCKNWMQAEVWFRHAVALRPQSAEAHNSLGNVLYLQKRMEESAAEYCRAIEIDPVYARAHINLGNTLLALGKHAQARACYERGLSIDGASPGGRYNLALMQLRNGEFQDGWRNHESRWDFEELHLGRRCFTRPMWQGESLQGKTILLHAEQGLGDTIQFARYAPLLASKGARVILEVQTPLVTLLRSMPGVASVIERHKPLPQFDLHCPFISLPHALGAELKTIPSPEGYLAVSKQAAEAARQKYPGSGMRIGLAWAGNPRHKADALRSMPLAAFLPLAKMPGITLFSLQKGAAVQQMAPLQSTLPILDAASDHNSMAETAALVATLDVVISIDTSIAHLAGAMGKPVWVLLAHLADWRWMEQRKDSPWYQSAKLIRQPSPGDWDSVIQQVIEELSGC
jgi:tetratricopeptide (TPR) repeat protein